MKKMYIEEHPIKRGNKAAVLHFPIWTHSSRLTHSNEEPAKATESSLSGNAAVKANDCFVVDQPSTSGATCNRDTSYETNVTAKCNFYASMKWDKQYDESAQEEEGKSNVRPGNHDIDFSIILTENWEDNTDPLFQMPSRPTP